MDSSRSDERGLTRTDVEALAVIFHDGTLSIQGDYARSMSATVAALASRGLITSLDIEGNPTRQWRLTYQGSFALALEEF
jgi:hypothetical protein